MLNVQVCAYIFVESSNLRTFLASTTSLCIIIMLIQRQFLSIMWTLFTLVIILPPPPSLSDPESTDTAPTSPPKSTPVLRNFECVCWELDPHLCLLSSAGTGQFNPHISWLLERLGFKHAQTTIPKWIQRVAMDPLDMVVANAMELLIKITATKKLQQKSRASSPPSH